MIERIAPIVGEQMILFTFLLLPVIGKASRIKLPSPPKLVFGGFIPIRRGSQSQQTQHLSRNEHVSRRFRDPTSRVSVDLNFPKSKISMI